MHVKLATKIFFSWNDNSQTLCFHCFLCVFAFLTVALFPPLAPLPSLLHFTPLCQPSVMHFSCSFFICLFISLNYRLHSLENTLVFYVVCDHIKQWNPFTLIFHFGQSSDFMGLWKSFQAEKGETCELDAIGITKFTVAGILRKCQNGVHGKLANFLCMYNWLCLAIIFSP